MGEPLHLLRGTVDALILKAVSAGPLHGYGIADFVHETTTGVLEIEDGALYRALHGMEERSWLEAEWGVSTQGRRAKFYRLTSAGRKRLDAEQRDWERYAEAVGRVFASRRGRDMKRGNRVRRGGPGEDAAAEIREESFAPSPSASVATRAAIGTLPTSRSAQS